MLSSFFLGVFVNIKLLIIFKKKVIKLVVILKYFITFVKCNYHIKYKKNKIMNELLNDFKKNVFMDETNIGIIKEYYKEDGFKQNIYFKVERGELDEKLIQECLDNIKPLLSNEKLNICNTPVVKYETNVYSVDEDNTLEKIVNHLDEEKFVLLYCPIVNNGVLNFKSRLL